MPENDDFLLEDENEEETPTLRSGEGGDNNDNIGDDNSDDDNNEEEEIMADPTPTPAGKLKRSALLHYLETHFDVTTQETLSWFLIGKDVEDMSVELNPETETKKNILDENSVTDKGYEPSFDVETYYATPTDGDFYTKLKDIAMNRKTDDACKTFCLEVIIDQVGASSYSAWKEEVIVKPKSYGGPQGGVSIPYTVTFTGNRVAGTVTMSDRVPTFSTT